jgi:hypothetical protein
MVLKFENRMSVFFVQESKETSVCPSLSGYSNDYMTLTSTPRSTDTSTFVSNSLRFYNFSWYITNICVAFVNFRSEWTRLHFWCFGWTVIAMTIWHWHQHQGQLIPQPLCQTLYPEICHLVFIHQKQQLHFLHRTVCVNPLLNKKHWHSVLKLQNHCL